MLFRRLLLVGLVAVLFVGTSAFADHNSFHTTACDLADSVGGGTAGNSPGPIGPPNSLGWDVGGGQCNGSFTVASDPAFPGGAIELGIRAEQRRVGQVTRNGVRDYEVQTGPDTTPPASTNRAWWNHQHSIAYEGDIDTLDALTLTIRTDVGPNVPSLPVFDLLAARAGVPLDDRNNNPNATSGFADLYQISQNAEFGWFAPASDTDSNPSGSFDWDAEGAWLFSLTAEKDGETVTVHACFHTPNAACGLVNVPASDGPAIWVLGLAMLVMLGGVYVFQRMRSAIA